LERGRSRPWRRATTIRRTPPRCPNLSAALLALELIAITACSDQSHPVRRIPGHVLGLKLAIYMAGC
jgi:hypothetical protein